MCVGPYIFHVFSRFGKFGPIKTEGRFVSPATKMIQVFVVSDNDTETDESTKGEDLVQIKREPPSSFLAGSTLGVKGPQVEDQTASLAVASLKLVGLGGLLLNLKNGITSVFTSLQHVLAGKDMETVKGVTSAFKLYAGSHHTQDQLDALKRSVDSLLTLILMERLKMKRAEEQGSYFELDYTRLNKVSKMTAWMAKQLSLEREKGERCVLRANGETALDKEEYQKLQEKLEAANAKAFSRGIVFPTELD
ncbi:hypothetical protein R1sor_027446 [Riccia sorocarpa]|uniref:Uncharacterized protein n=1 Tax=Riccia sorocarpa TaxID=122646 RepID=A0ABD3GEZ2_9MARC